MKNEKKQTFVHIKTISTKINTKHSLEQPEGAGQTDDISMFYSNSTEVENESLPNVSETSFKAFSADATID